MRESCGIGSKERDTGVTVEEPAPSILAVTLSWSEQSVGERNWGLESGNVM